MIAWFIVDFRSEESRLFLKNFLLTTPLSLILPRKGEGMVGVYKLYRVELVRFTNGKGKDLWNN